jgi:nucleoside-diphosphate-sugar epimerase
MHKVLITGANGFIGRHVLPRLLARGYEVHAVSRRLPTMKLPGVLWHECDLLRAGSGRALLGQLRPDSLLHLAWYAVPGSFWEARENVEWLRASLEMLAAFTDSGGRRMVAVGTCAEYDCSGGQCIEEITSLSPTTLYATSKHALERALHYWSRSTNLSSAWGRVFYLYGPHEHPSRLVASVVRSLLRGEPALCSAGTQVRDFLHVEDAAAAFVALLESEVEGAVNIASGIPITVRTLLEQIAEQIGRPELLRLGARDASREAPRIWASIQRLKDEVGWGERYDLSAGIAQTIAWWRRSLEVPRPPALCDMQP